jgi:hypothetical protein
MILSLSLILPLAGSRLMKNDRESFPESAVNGSSFQNGTIEEEHMRLLNLEEIE